jgi:flagellar biosynthetic protein FlhB
MPAGSDQERTEKATPRRRQEARKKGQVAKSRELPSAIVLLGGVLFLWLAGKPMVNGIMGLWRDLIAQCGLTTVSLASMSAMGMELAGRTALLLGPMVVGLAILALMSNIAQVGLVVATEALSPKLSNLNPIRGLKRIFSLRSIMETFKSFLKILIVGYVAWTTIRGEWQVVFPMMGSSGWAVGSHMAIVIMKIGLRTALALVVLGVLDYIYQRWEYERNLRMTKQEVKDEFREREGDPKVKSRIRSKQMEMARRRMMAAVPKADVVITNPQELAVALQYESETMDAPTVVAKGAGYLAEKIKEVARRHGVPIVENKPLARALFQRVEIGFQIPPALYKAVAEILAHVYRMRNAG